MSRANKTSGSDVRIGSTEENDGTRCEVRAEDTIDDEVEIRNESSDDLFSDDNEAQNLSCFKCNKSRIMEAIDSPLSTTKTPVPYRTPNNASAPRMPSNLAAILSNVNESWTSDLETPNAKKYEKISSHVSALSEPLGNVTNREHLLAEANTVCNNPSTTVDVAVSELQTENLYISPVLNGRKHRRRPKRRIFQIDKKFGSSRKGQMDHDANNDSSFYSIASENVSLDVTGQHAIFDATNHNLDSDVSDKGVGKKSACGTEYSKSTKTTMCVTDNSNSDTIYRLHSCDQVGSCQDAMHDPGSHDKADNCKTKIPTSVVKKTVDSQVVDVLKKNEYPKQIEDTSSTQDFFNNISFTAIDNICLNETDRESNQTVIDIAPKSEVKINFDKADPDLLCEDNITQNKFGGVETIASSVINKTVNPQCIDPHNVNESSPEVNDVLSTQDFFNNISFTTIDKISLDETEKHNEKIIKIGTESAIKNKMDNVEHDECNNAIEESVPKNIKHIEITTESMSSSQSFTKCDRTINPSSPPLSLKDGHEKNISSGYKRLADRVRNIKLARKPRNRFSACKDANIALEEFTKDARALESANMPLVTQQCKHSNIRSQLGLIPFSKLCLLESENSNNRNENTDNSKSNKPGHVVSGSEGIDNPEHRDVELNKSLPQTSGAVKKLGVVDGLQSSSLLCKKRFDSLGNKLDSTGDSEGIASQNNLNRFIPETKNTVPQCTTLSLEEDEIGSQDIFKEADSEDVINTQFKLGETAEMPIKINCDIEEFSEWVYNPDESLQNLPPCDDQSCIESKPHSGMNSKTSDPSRLIDIFLCGFSTAGGKALSVSKNKLQMAEKLFEEIDDVNFCDETESTCSNTRNLHGLKDFSIARGKSITTNDDKMQNEEKLLVHNPIATEENVLLRNGSRKNPSETISHGIGRSKSHYGNHLNLFHGFSTADIKASKAFMKRAEMFKKSVNIQRGSKNVLNRFDSMPENKETISQYTTLSLEEDKTESQDIFQESDSEDPTDTQKMRLLGTAEMPIKITDDIEEFSEWMYIPNGTQQKVLEPNKISGIIEPHRYLEAPISEEETMEDTSVMSANRNVSSIDSNLFHGFSISDIETSEAFIKKAEFIFQSAVKSQSTSNNVGNELVLPFEDEKRSDDIFKKVDIKDVTGTEMWRLGERVEMAGETTDDIAEFSEWLYNPDKLLQENDFLGNVVESTRIKKTEPHKSPETKICKNSEKFHPTLCRDQSNIENKENSELNVKTSESIRLTDYLQCGFLTAGGKTLSVSEYKLQMAKNLFEEICNDDESTRSITRNPQCSNYSSFAREKNDDKMQKTTKLLDDNCMATKENILLKIGVHNSVSESFSNATGKSITAERRGVKRKNGGNNCHVYKSNSFGGCTTVNEESSTAVCEKAMKDSSCSRNAPLNHNKSEFTISLNLFHGFSTADIEASETCVKKVKLMLPNETKHKTPIKAELPKELSTAVINSNETISGKAGVSLIDINDKISIIDKQVHTGNNQLFETTQETFSYDKDPFVNQIDAFKISESIQVGFLTARGKPVQVSDKALSKARTLFHEEEDTENFPLLDSDPAVENKILAFGFSTASGREVKVSKEALSKAKTLFSSDFENAMVNNHSTENASTPTSTPTRVSVSSIDFQPGNGRNASPFGFATASGRKVKVSKEALSKAKTLFSSDFENAIVTDHSTENAGTSTSTPVVVSVSSIDFQPGNGRNAPFGFATASGREVKISKEALSKAKTLFSSDFENAIVTDHSIENAGTSTPTPAVVSVSSIDFQPGNGRNAPFGFATASGQEVKVSKEALSKAKTLFSSDSENATAIKYATKVASSSNSTSERGLSICTPDLKSTLKRKYQDDTPLGRCDSSQPKHAKFSNELTARKLFIKDDSDEEIGNTERYCIKENETFTIPLNDDGCISHRLWQEEDRNIKNVTRKDNDECRESDMKGNDRDISATFQPLKFLEDFERSVPGIDTSYCTEGTHDDMMIPVLGANRGMPSASDEIMASTVALLADVEHSRDEMSWSFGFTSNPPILEDRTISTEPIRIDDTGEIVKEMPSSPIIMNRVKSQIRKRGGRMKALRKARMNTIREEDSTCKDDSYSYSSNYTRRVDTSSSLHKRLDSDNKSSGGPETNLQILSRGNMDAAEYSITCGTKKSECPSSSSFEVPDKNFSVIPMVPPTKNFKVPYRNGAIQSANPSDIQPKSAPEQLDFNTPFSTNFEGSSRTNIYSDESNLFEERLAAKLEQDKIIRTKKKNKPRPIMGNLLYRKIGGGVGITWRQATKGSPPIPCTLQELNDRGIGMDVLEITAATAISYKFNCADFYSETVVRNNARGFEVGDGARLIVDENGYAGISEFLRAFLASPGVDPGLIPLGWLENHYKWIIWKLASTDRKKFGDVVMPRMLTPHRVMEQLKYRYDREIDRSQRPALRKILEKDDPACRRVVLCVATITKPEDNEDTAKSMKVSMTPQWKVEMTDGWYHVPASIDMAMMNYIANGKVQEGTKLITYGAELVNSDQGCSPLEIPADVCLKIHTNSTRRARWDVRLGYQPCPGPIPTSLKAVHPNGGQIGKLTTIVARVYPLLYREKTADGGSIFRNARCEEKVAMAYEQERQSKVEMIYSQARAELEAKQEKRSKTTSRNDSSQQNSAEMLAEQWSRAPDVLSFEAGLTETQRQSLLNHHRMSEEKFQRDLESRLFQNLPAPRQISPLLRVRIVEGGNTATLTVWAPSEEVMDVLREGSRVSIHNAYASGKRSGELQLTASRQSFINQEALKDDSCPTRSCTLLSEVAVSGFNPPFNEFDTVGIVVSIGAAPHGMKNFETVNLAYPSPDSSTSTYLSVLFWEGIAAHGYTDILNVGSVVSCSNLQWRPSMARNVPTAYCTEKTVFTRNPRPLHLRVPFDNLTKQVKNTNAYATICADEIASELLKKSTFLRSPAQGTPNKFVPVMDKHTPGRSPQIVQGSVTPSNPTGVTPVKSSTQRRLEKLQWYGTPPDLSPIHLNHGSKKVIQEFRPPVRTPAKKL